MIEAAQFHWNRVLTFLATALVYVPMALLVASSAFEVSDAQDSTAADTTAATPPELNVDFDPLTLLAVVALLAVLSSASFVLWLRMSLMGMPTALQQPLGNWLGQILRTMGLFLAAGLVGLVPVSFLGGLLVGSTGTLSPGALAFLVLLSSATVNGAIALLFLPFVEAATGVKPLGTSETRARANALRPVLALTLITATFAVTFVGGVIMQILVAGGATISAGLVQAMTITFSVTYIAAIMGCAFRRLSTE